jgi:hypothetical protein
LPKSIFILGLSIFLGSCNTSKNSFGKYRSNFPESGQQIKTLILKPDSTFEFIIRGNLIYDSTFGKFQIWKHTLFLSKIWEKTGPYRWSLLERQPKIFILGSDSIEYQSIFYLDDNKIFPANFETGKKQKKVVVYNKRKKYILFGTHLYKKNWYLKRVD